MQPMRIQAVRRAPTLTTHIYPTALSSESGRPFRFRQWFIGPVAFCVFDVKPGTRLHLTYCPSFSPRTNLGNLATVAAEHDNFILFFDCLNQFRQSGLC